MVSEIAQVRRMEFCPIRLPLEMWKRENERDFEMEIDRQTDK